jgi:signal transduction histidine kinase
MKSPRTLVVDSYTALPFNLSRWFAIVGLITITAVSTASAFFLSQFLTERMLYQEGILTMEFVQSLVLTDKSISEYFIAGNSGNSSTELEAGLRHIAGMPDVLRANIYNSQRALIWSSDRDILGRKFHSNPELDDALKGKLIVHDADDFEPGPGQKEEHSHLEEADGHIIEIYVPVSDASGGTVMGAIELYKRPRALTESLQKAHLFILIGAGLSGLFLYLSLFGLSRRADALIHDQRKRLVETEILATIGEMGSAVAHGIRNPLASIRSSAELSLGASHAVAMDAARDIIAEADRLEEWVRNLLSYSSPLSVATEAFPMQALVVDTMEHFSREMEKRSISSLFEPSQDLPLAKGDPLLLGQVLHSLLANAIEAIQQGGRIEIACRSVPARQRVELTVRDSGPGMSRDQLARVFTPFYTTKTKGLGVGLALAKRIVERSGGRITIHSNPGHGTAVCLSMQIA